MVEALGKVAIPFLGGLGLTWVLECLLTPRPPAPWRRPRAAVVTHVAIWTIGFGLELILFSRPYVAMANLLAILVLLMLVNNAKFRALREPFVFPDFEYFLDALRHPRLYLPFLSVPLAVGAAAGYGAAMWLGLMLEPSLISSSVPAGTFYTLSMGLAVVGFAVARWSVRRVRVSFEAVQDLRDLGLVATLCSYAYHERQPAARIAKRSGFADSFLKPSGAASQPGRPRDLVCIQSESFFDVRRVYPSVRASVLENYDRLCRESLCHGRLKVGSWGANTVRTEFAFLSGMHDADLGIHRFNPYRRLAQTPVPTFASHLRSLGYRTICIHPYHASFYQRHKVLPNLGFDEFIDISAFREAHRCGPYVGDIALAEFAVRFLQEDDERARPLYLHIITMENHGPLHWEKVAAADAHAVLNGPLPAGCDDLVAYTRHLRNADASFLTLSQALQARKRPGLLCIYGDHVPIMPDVYAKLGYPDGMTDYLVWAPDQSRAGRQRDIPIQDLADILLRQL